MNLRFSRFEHMYAAITASTIRKSGTYNFLLQLVFAVHHILHIYIVQSELYIGDVMCYCVFGNTFVCCTIAR